jgi:glycine/D-amino acid oxidase-like deaminating enzyme
VKTAVVGGGIVGLFTAWYLEREGVDVTLFEEGPLGAGSVHAAGIIEPANAYRTNTVAYLRRVWRLWRRGTCTFRQFDSRWLWESLHQLERTPPEGMDGCLREMAATAMARYEALAQEKNDFQYTESGVLESYDDPQHFSQERGLALARKAYFPVEVREREGGAGALFFPEVSWLHTEQFAERMVRELAGTNVVRRRVRRVELDGTVITDAGPVRFDAVAVCTGVSCRNLGVPLTGVRGYGWHTRGHRTTSVAVIFEDRGIAAVPFADGLKVTGGWDFDFSSSPYQVENVLNTARGAVPIDTILDFKQGSRPCTPDGLPTVGKKERMVVATGGFRLGWSFGPALGRHAALLCLDQTRNQPFLSRFCGRLHSGSL